MKEQPELLDPKKLMMAISPVNQVKLVRLDIFKSIPSTNTYLLSQAKQDLEQRKSGWACFAEQQTQGRGRQGKEWFSPYATNIYCSLGWSFPSSFAGLSALSLACGAMLIRTLETLGLNQGLGLKWPNDILFSNRKLAGILLENLVSPRQNWVVIGLGVNLRLPSEKNEAWIGVEEALGRTCSRNSLAGLLLDELLTGLSLFEDQGLKPFLPLIRTRDLLAQQEVGIHTARQTVRGLAQGISEEGKLLLLDEKGKYLQFSYGEVSVRPVNKS